MKFLKNKLAVTVIVLSVTFLGVIIFTLGKNTNNVFSNSAGVTLNPVQKLAYNISDNIKSGMTFFYTFSDVKKENEELKKKNIELENKLIDYDNFKNENERLSKILEFKNQRSDYNYVGAHIIGKSGGSFLDGYIIDKGQKDGIEKEMVVIAADGLVGQVTSVNSNWSIVQSIVNENIAVHAIVESTRDSSGIVKGYKDSNNNLLAKLWFLPMNSEIKEGDVITTSGLGKLYPKDIRIGKVLSVEEDKVKVNKNAVIQPFVDFNKLEELFIIVPKEKRDFIEY